MYIPAAFAETDLTKLHDFIEQHSFNQNHPAERRKKVVRALGERSDENAQAIAAMMQAMLPSER